MTKRPAILAALIVVSSFTGCTGWNPGEIMSGKPYTYIRGGDQFGRDQLANRWLVGENKLDLKGRDANEVITYLGQPQEILVRQHKIAEDWFFIYYKAYKTRPETEQSSFIVRMYHDQVIDVVRDPALLPEIA
jgi:hypothetical protein